MWQTFMHATRSIYILNTCMVGLGNIAAEKWTHLQKCDASHSSMKLRSKSGDIWQTVMHPLRSICILNMVGLGIIVAEKWT